MLTCDISHHSLTLAIDNKLYLAPLKKDIAVRNLALSRPRLELNHLG